jgi:hypothetical protein
MKRKVALLIAICALSLGLVPSHAATGYAAGVFNGTAHLPKFPCGTGLTCSGGTFSGTFRGRIGGKNVTGAPMSASFSYTEPDTVNSLCAVKGSAAGSITIAGQSGSFTWSRTGLTAVVHFTVSGHAGTSVAVFLPVSTGFCKPLKPAAINATVAGVAATTN